MEESCKSFFYSTLTKRKRHHNGLATQQCPCQRPDPANVQPTQFRHGNEPQQRQVLHHPLELLKPDFSYRQHRQRNRRKPQQLKIRIRPSEPNLPRVRPRDPRRRNGKVHNLQRIERRVRHVPDNEPQPAHHRRLR